VNGERGGLLLSSGFSFSCLSQREIMTSTPKKKRRVENSFHFGNRQKISSTKVNVMCYVL
jgi:hypothetical protein